MGLLAVVNPSRRRRRRKASASRRRSRRRMTAKQLKYFGPRKRRAVRRRRRAMLANPIGNPRRRRARRSFRRNPIGAPRFRMGYITGAVQDAAVGAAGALATDLAMAQAARVLPATMTSRANAEGGVNFGYYGAKLAIAVGLGVLGTQFLPGRMRQMAGKATAGALTVQAYELTRAMLPADLVLGYFTPAPLAGRRLGAYLSPQRRAAPALPAQSSPAARAKLGAYFSTGPSFGAASEERIGEGAIQ